MAIRGRPDRLLNVIMFGLCTVFQSDFEPTVITSLVVPFSCAYASLWVEKKKYDKLRKSE